MSRAIHVDDPNLLDKAYTSWVMSGDVVIYYSAAATRIGKRRLRIRRMHAMYHRRRR